LLPGGRTVFAQGVVALWIPPGSKAAVKRIEDLAGPDVRVIAIAKPELAHYDEAIRALQSLASAKRSSPAPSTPKISICAKQYGASRNADVVFTA
jgi:hypothetical protein